MANEKFVPDIPLGFETVWEKFKLGPKSFCDYCDISKELAHDLPGLYSFIAGVSQWDASRYTEKQVAALKRTFVYTVLPIMIERMMEITEREDSYIEEDADYFDF